MVVNDKLGKPIQFYNNFPNDSNVNNIEFGAGRNHFGKIEFPNCYLTDLSYPVGKFHFFSRDIISDTEEYHYLDNICDFYKTNISKKFENIIFCNPFGYGFKGLGDAKKFFDRAGDLLLNNGRIHIIGSSKNEWCKKESFDNYMRTSIVLYKSKYNFELESFDELNNKHHIRLNYKFYSTGLEVLTRPNQRLIIKKLEHE